MYAYLLCCENRRTHQCHPSYKTIANAAGLSVNIVMKHVTMLADKQLITMEHTSYIDDRGIKWTGNNCYTILSVQQAVEAFYQQELNRLKDDAERQRIAKLLQEQEAPHNRLLAAVHHNCGRDTPYPSQQFRAGFGPLFRRCGGAPIRGI